MRLFLKLLLIVLVLCMASRPHVRQASSDLMFELHNFVVYCCGSAADHEALVDEAQRMNAEREGRMDVYLTGKRAQRLYAERLADAAARGVRLTSDDTDRLHAECIREAFGGGNDVDDAGPARSPSAKGR
jgi:hypothetical protein